MLMNIFDWSTGAASRSSQLRSVMRRIWFVTRNVAGADAPRSTWATPVHPWARLLSRCALCMIGLLAATHVGAQTISTVVGNGAATFAGDGGAALAGSLNNPSSVVADSAGNLYVADRLNQRIRKISVAGIITTVAGNGTAGAGGDGGAATSASLNSPQGVALDSVGNIYVSDRSNHRIRKITVATGVITTVAGTGGNSFTGDGGPATSANLNNPRGIALDGAGNIYIADTSNNRIRMVTASTGVITTVAGNGAATFAGDGGAATAASVFDPRGVAVDAAGTIFVADFGNQRIRMVSAGIISTVAGTGTAGFSNDGGQAISANLNNPLSVAVDAVGNIYVADFFNTRIRRFRVGATITTVAGNGTQGISGDGGPATAASFNGPVGVALDTLGNIYVADDFNNRIRKITGPPGVIASVAGNGTAGGAGDGNLATGANLSSPAGVAVDSARNIYVADLNNHRIRKVTVATGIITTVVGNGVQAFAGDGAAASSASMNSPRTVVLDNAGNMYVADSLNQRIRKIAAATGVITTVVGNGTQGFAGDGGPPTSANLSTPFGVAVDGAGNLYVADTGNNRIRKVTIATGTITTLAGNGTAGFSGDGGLAGGAVLNSPRGVAVDRAGNVYIADFTNNRIRKITVATGIITTVAGTGTNGFSGDGGPATSANIANPRGIAFDGAGNLYFADLTNDRVRKISATTGIITTLAGDGTSAFSGDGGSPTGARLSGPFNVTIDDAGNVYIADTGNQRVRKFSQAVPGAPTIGTATSGNVQASVAFTPGIAGGSPITGYTVTASPGGVTATGASSPIVIAGLTNGTAYTFTVTATNAIGMGVASAASNSVTPAVPAPPGAPTIGTATPGNTQASVSFTPPGSAGTSPITGYTVTSSPGSFTASGAGSPLVVTGLTNGTAYTFTVTATNAVGTGVASAASNSVVPAPVTPPGAPTNITATAGNAQASVSFSAPGNDGGSAITGYTVTSSPGNFTATGASSPIVVTGLTNGTTYTFTVTAANVSGSSAASTASNTVTPGTTPGAPTIASVMGGNTQVSVAFAPPASNGGLTILDYTATCGTQSATNATSPIIVTGLINGTPVTCTVKARNAIGSSAASQVSGSVTPVAIGGNIPGFITTVAGNGATGYSGDGGPAGSASFNYPVGVSLDSTGNIYVADQFNHRIRKITVSTGVITTVAGVGSPGFGGDGGPATAAALAFPLGLAVVGANTVFVGDQSNHRIRKVRTSPSLIATVAGSGSNGFAGDGGPATSASFAFPGGVAIDSAGDIYVADQSNNRVRKITVATGVVTTVAGTGAAAFSGDGGGATSASLKGPYGIAVDSADNIYVADMNNHRIRKITVATGVITTVAGNGVNDFAGDGGPATAASLSIPSGIAFDGAGNMYVADQGNARVRRVTLATGIISTVAGNGTVGFAGDGGPATSASLSNPTSIAIDGAGHIYIADTTNHRVRMFTLVDVPGAPTIGAATAGDAEATVNFTAPVSDGGSAILSYVATSVPGNITGNCTAPCTSITVSGLTNGTAYTFTVQAINNVGTGAASMSVVVTPAPASTLTLTAVQSRKTHGSAGTFDLRINHAQPLTGTITVEPRITLGPGHLIVFQFSGPVTAAGTASTTIGNAMATFAGNEVIVTLTNVPDNQRLTITLSNVNGTTNVPPVSMGFLVGDVNNTRSVNSADSSQVKARSGQAVDATNFWFDLNATGSINAADVSAVKARVGMVMP